MKNSQEISDFEKLIASNGNEAEIKYTVDVKIESEVRYDYLVEVYGNDLIDSVVKQKDNLFDQDYYSAILAELEENK